MIVPFGQVPLGTRFWDFADGEEFKKVDVFVGEQITDHDGDDDKIGEEKRYSLSEAVAALDTEPELGETSQAVRDARQLIEAWTRP